MAHKKSNVNWNRPLKRGTKPEIGRVYYLNARLIFPDKDEWVKNEIQFSVNTAIGRTFESEIAKKTVLTFMQRKELIREFTTEMRDPQGVVLQMWISESEAPFKWGPPELRKQLQHQLNNQ